MFRTRHRMVSASILGGIIFLVITTFPSGQLGSTAWGWMILKINIQEQGRRLRNVERVCQSVSPNTVPPNLNSFLQHEPTKTVYCYINKCGSSTWMGLFTDLYEYQDHEFARKIKQTKDFLEIKNRMPVKSQFILTSPEYFSFLVVRHPLDRVLSAFRDRVLSGCTRLAKEHVPNILQSHDVFDENKCVNVFPTFQQFVEYLVRNNNTANVNSHWIPYVDQCSPCRVNYDAVVKLERPEDGKYVMTATGMDKYATLQHRHATSGGKTEIARSEYFTQLPCGTLDELINLYKVDMKMFEYDDVPFRNLCKK